MLLEGIYFSHTSKKHIVPFRHVGFASSFNAIKMMSIYSPSNSIMHFTSYPCSFIIALPPKLGTSLLLQQLKYLLFEYSNVHVLNVWTSAVPPVATKSSTIATLPCKIIFLGYVILFLRILI